MSVLAERLRALHPGASHRTVKQWLARGRVRVNGEVVRRGDVPVSAGDRVRLGEPPPPPFPAALRLVHEDDDLLVVDKPPGLLTIATERERERTAYRLLSDYARAQPSARGHPRPLFIVHRLDRETSGLVVFAKSPAVKRRLQEQFEARRVERIYVAVVEGHMAEASGTLESRVREDRNLRVRSTRDRHAGKEAITRYRVLERRAESTVVELSLVTGRRGQIRAQLAALGHPVVGDLGSGSRRNPVRRLCLHATRLAFVHPNGQRVSFESRPPAAFGRA